jgi:hypothetical protein
MWKCAKEANNSITLAQKKIAHAAGANLLAAAVRKAARRHAKKSRRESEEGEMISILLLVFFLRPGLFNSLLLTGQSWLRIMIMRRGY